jgi:PAS domain S-box-containing protein
VAWPPQPLVALLWAIAALLAVLALVAWSRRSRTRGARSFTFFTLAGAVWALAEGMQNGVVDPAQQLLWLQLKYLGIATLPVGLLVFANDYTRQAAWLNRFVIALLLVVPAVTIAMAWAYPLQDALWRSVEVVGGRLLPEPGDWFWVHTYSSYAWLALGSFYLLRGYVGTPRRYRRQITWVLAAVLVPWAANVVMVFGAPDLPVDLTPLTFAVSAVAFSHSLFSHRLLDIVPVARETVMRHLGDAIVVFDLRGLVLQANPASAALLGLRDAEDAVGRSAVELFPDQDELRRRLVTDVAVDVDIVWKRTEPPRWFNAQVVPLTDRQGRQTGHLLRLQDTGRQVLAERTLREAERRLAEQEAYLQALRDVTDGLARRAPVGEILEAVLRRAAHALAADHGIVHLVEPGGGALLPHRTLGRFAELAPIVLKRGEGLAGSAWRAARTLRIDDYKHWQGRLQGIDLGFLRAAMAAPLASGGAPLGVIALARSREDTRTFRPDEEDLLGRFAQLAAIALDQVGLIEEIEARRRESDQLSRIGTAMQEPTSPQERMDLVLQAIQDVVGVERAVVWLPGADDATLEATSWVGFDEAIVGAQRIPLDGSAPLLERAYREGREWVADPVRAIPSELRAAPHLAQVKLLRSRAPAVLPLVSRGRTVGVLAVDNPTSRRPLDGKLPVLRRFAASAGVAIDSALLYEAVQAELVERRAAETELRRSEEKYRTILDTIQDAYFEADTGGVLRLANPAFVTGLGAASLDDVLGKSYRRFVHHADVRELMEAFIGVMRTGQPEQRRESRFRRRDGGTFDGELSIGPVFDGDGTVVGFRGIVRDVSDRKLHEEELRAAKEVAEAANASKSAFLANVSHELRTPLTSILGFARLIERRFDEVVAPALAGTEDRKVQRALQQVRTNAGIIYSESQRLTHLINEVLDLAKIEAGRVDWRMAPLSMGEVVERAAQATAGLFEQKPDVRMVVDLAAGVPPVIGDRDRLTQVVINLVSNAVKFTPAGDVTLTVAQGVDPEVGDAIVVGVRDTGVGIAPEDHAAVFEQFRQVGDTLTEKPQGTGLGLPICRQIVEHHGGRLWLESAIGAGSTFSFAIPLTAPEHVIADADAARSERDAAAATPVAAVGAAAPAASTVAAVATPVALPPAAGGDGVGAAATPAPVAAGAASPRGPATVLEGLAGAPADPIEPVVAADPTRVARPAAQAAHAALRRRVAALLRRTLADGSGEGLGAGAGTAVLVVDDDARVRSLLRQELEEAGHRVIEAADGRAALEAVKRYRPDLVVLDVMMPELSGFDVAAVLKGDPETARIPIMILSVVDDPERGVRLGVERYFTKPVDVRALLTEVEALLRDAAAGTRVAVVDPWQADADDRGQARRVIAALVAAGFVVERLPDAEDAVASMLRRGAAGQPDLVVAGAAAARSAGMGARLRDAGIPVVLFQ